RRSAFPDCTPDTVNGFRYLHQAYTASDPRYTGKVTVPTLWDKKTGRIVNNESSEIIRMLNSEFAGVADAGTDLYPQPLRAEIDPLNEAIYANVNNGVYRCGFAKPRSTNSTSGFRAGAICSAARSRRPIGGSFPRWCASTSPTSRSFAATSGGLPTIPISQITCASFIRCPALPRR